MHIPVTLNAVTAVAADRPRAQHRRGVCRRHAGSTAVAAAALPVPGRRRQRGVVHEPFNHPADAADLALRWL